jgi:hypothetical protein
LERSNLQKISRVVAYFKYPFILSMNKLSSDWAKIVSDVVSPPVVWTIMAFPVAARDAPSTEKALTWAFLYIFLLALLPTLYVLLQVRRGNITDRHMPLREERIRPSLVLLSGGIIATLAFNVTGASTTMWLFILSNLIQIALMTLISMFWQISIHMMSITGAVVLVGVLFGIVPALIMSPLILIVALARLKLHRHTRAQVIAGFIVGGLSVGILLAAAAAIEPGVWSQH